MEGSRTAAVRDDQPQGGVPLEQSCMKTAVSAAM
jgi:hypothetical protein